jgi:hypothetical protein
VAQICIVVQQMLRAAIFCARSPPYRLNAVWPDAGWVNIVWLHREAKHAR